jgi:histidine ammonia-lyase
MQEDHVSMGWSAARKLRRAVEALRRVLAIELMTAARGIELRRPLASSPAISAAIGVIRTAVPGVGEDRFLAPEISAMVELVSSERLVSAVESTIGALR